MTEAASATFLAVRRSPTAPVRFVSSAAPGCDGRSRPSGRRPSRRMPVAHCLTGRDATSDHIIDVRATGARAGPSNRTQALQMSASGRTRPAARRSCRCGCWPTWVGRGAYCRRRGRGWSSLGRLHARKLVAGRVASRLPPGAAFRTPVQHCLGALGCPAYPDAPPCSPRPSRRLQAVGDECERARRRQSRQMAASADPTPRAAPFVAPLARPARPAQAQLSMAAHMLLSV